VSRVLGVLPWHQSVVVPGIGAHVLTEDDVDAWAAHPGQTAVTFGGASGRNPAPGGASGSSGTEMTRPGVNNVTSTRSVATPVGSNRWQ
jgi:hypothetical protein